MDPDPPFKYGPGSYSNPENNWIHNPDHNPATCTAIGMMHSKDGPEIKLAEYPALALDRILN